MVNIHSKRLRMFDIVNAAAVQNSGGFRISSRGWRVFLEISSGGGDNLPGGGEKIAL